ncbi:hypothetical protein [Rhodoblastus sp.]|uniref:hypothetical protein n=1 Tax=Rhodoblastus sp. TaxID=1962975 RepID=UPI00260FB81E|nr:hypothetical protein [Rhodoblastus sp.]
MMLPRALAVTHAFAVQASRQGGLWRLLAIGVDPVGIVAIRVGKTTWRPAVVSDAGNVVILLHSLRKNLFGSIGCEKQRRNRAVLLKCRALWVTHANIKDFSKRILVATKFVSS